MSLTPAEAVACCSPLTQEPLSHDQAERIAPLLKALADPVRLRLLSLVASHQDGEACVCDLNDAFDLSQPTISHHLKVLHEVGLLDRSKRGVWVYYRIRGEDSPTSAPCSGEWPGEPRPGAPGGRGGARDRVPGRGRDRVGHRCDTALAGRRGAAAAREQSGHRRRAGGADPGAPAGVGVVQPGGDPGRAGLGTGRYEGGDGPRGGPGGRRVLRARSWRT